MNSSMCSFLDLKCIDYYHKYDPLHTYCQTQGHDVFNDVIATLSETTPDLRY